MGLDIITNKDSDKTILKRLKYYKRHKKLDRVLANCMGVVFNYKDLIDQREAPDYINNFFLVEASIEDEKEIAILASRILVIYGLSGL